MTDNMKAFLTEASKDEAFLERVKKVTTVGEAIALAAEKGFSLCAEDLGLGVAPSAEITDDELDAVAGGRTRNTKEQVDGWFERADSHVLVCPYGNVGGVDCNKYFPLDFNELEEKERLTGQVDCLRSGWVPGGHVING